MLDVASTAVDRDDVVEAAKRIEGFVERTPSIEGEVGGVRTWFKCECLQTGGSFKLRGATNRLLQLSPQILSAVIARCCEIKAEIVGQDETESGRRAILNFGHTIGHAIENSTGYGRYLHGEAIAIGQVAAARLSQEVLRLSAESVARIQRLFERAGLPTQLKLNAALRLQILAAMKLDKKVSGGQIKFVLAEKIGKVRWGQQVPPSLIEGTLMTALSSPSPPAGK